MANFTGWRPTRTGIIYIIVAIVLAAVVLGAAWYVQERGQQVRQQQATEIAQQNLEEESDTPVISGDDPAPAEEERTGQNGTNGSTQAGGNSDRQNLPSGGSGVATNGSPDTLPATGTDEVAILLGVTALAFASAFYATSRRAVHQL